MLLVTAGITGAALAHRADAAVLPSVSARTSEQRPERPPGVPTDTDLQAEGARIGRIRVNADNDILYSDHLLAEAIRLLQSRGVRLDAALLYVSDHGESLGEGGLYLHGMPRAIAPSTQTQVPMIFWQSTGFADAAGVATNCVRSRAGMALSHDNLFHSVLGLLEVRTAAHRPERDLFAPCARRRGNAPAK